MRRNEKVPARSARGNLFKGDLQMFVRTLAAVMTASVFSAAAAAADGTFTASAQGQAGPVPVSVTV